MRLLLPSCFLEDLTLSGGRQVANSFEILSTMDAAVDDLNRRDKSSLARLLEHDGHPILEYLSLYAFRELPVSGHEPPHVTVRSLGRHTKTLLGMFQEFLARKELKHICEMETANGLTVSPSPIFDLQPASSDWSLTIHRTHDPLSNLEPHKHGSIYIRPMDHRVWDFRKTGDLHDQVTEVARSGRGVSGKAIDRPHVVLVVPVALGSQHLIEAGAF